MVEHGTVVTTVYGSVTVGLLVGVTTVVMTVIEGPSLDEELTLLESLLELLANPVELEEIELDAVPTLLEDLLGLLTMPEELGEAELDLVTAPGVDGVEVTPGVDTVVVG